MIASVTIHSKKIKSRNNIFIINLMIADFIVGKCTFYVFSVCVVFPCFHFPAVTAHFLRDNPIHSDVIDNQPSILRISFIIIRVVLQLNILKTFFILNYIPYTKSNPGILTMPITSASVLQNRWMFGTHLCKVSIFDHFYRNCHHDLMNSDLLFLFIWLRIYFISRLVGCNQLRPVSFN